MDTETFRVDFLRLPFLVVGLAVLAYAFYAASSAGASILVGPLVLLTVGAVAGWYFGVVQVGEAGFVLYRTSRARWEEVVGVRRLSVLGLPYLLVSRTVGRPWFVPLYVTGPRSLVESLVARAPPGTEFAATLRRLVLAATPRGKSVA
jgi:hypothetical protein